MQSSFALNRAVRSATTRRPGILAAAWLALVAAGMTMAVWAGIEDRLPGDAGVATWIQEQDPAGQFVIDFTRDTGSTVAALGACAVLAAWLILTGRPRMAAWISLIVLGFVLQWGLKELVDRPRPSADLLEHRTGYRSPSFPSGHAMSSLMVGVLAIYLARVSAPRWWLALPVAGWGLFTALLNPWISVASGVHWPSDSLGGVVWAGVVLVPTLAGMGRARLRDEAGDPRRPPGRRLLRRLR